MTTIEVGTRVTYRDPELLRYQRFGTVVSIIGTSASVRWDDAPENAHPWYDIDALIPVVKANTAPTDRQRAESYRAEMNRLASTLKAVERQRDILAAELLNGDELYSRATVDVLTDLVKSGIIDHRGLLS